MAGVKMASEEIVVTCSVGRHPILSNVTVVPHFLNLIIVFTVFNDLANALETLKLLS